MGKRWEVRGAVRKLWEIVNCWYGFRYFILLSEAPANIFLLQQTCYAGLKKKGAILDKLQQNFYTPVYYSYTFLYSLSLENNLFRQWIMLWNRVNEMTCYGRNVLMKWLVLAGTWRDELWPDKWTAVTADGMLSAQFEQTLLVTDTGVEILTGRKANNGQPHFTDKL